MSPKSDSFSFALTICGKSVSSNFAPLFAALAQGAGVDLSSTKLSDVLFRCVTTEELVVSGGLMKIVVSLTFPSPKGPLQITRQRVDEFFRREAFALCTIHKKCDAGAFDNGTFERSLGPTATNDDLTCGPIYLSNIIPPGVLRRYGYEYWDRWRFYIAFLYELTTIHKALFLIADEPAMFELTLLAKRDLRQNNVVWVKQLSQHGNAKEPARNGPSSLVVHQGARRGMKQLLLEACAVEWPYLLLSKAVTFSEEQDQSEPKSQRRFRATVEIVPLKKAHCETTFVGEWCRTKFEAVNAASEVALKALYARKTRASS